VVWEDAHRRKVQLAGKFPDNLCGNLSKAAPRCIVSQDHAKENCPLAAPILADLVSDTHHVWADDLPDSLDRCIDFCAPRDRKGRVHLDLSLPLISAQFTEHARRADSVGRRYTDDDRPTPLGFPPPL
jgi:hypothetical protein